jgi:hypothetical protein
MNVVIKSRYALLDMKCSATETRLKALLEWINEVVIADINRRYHTAYKLTQVGVSSSLEAHWLTTQTSHKGHLLMCRLKKPSSTASWQPHLNLVMNPS